MFAQEDTLVKMLVEAGADVHAKNKDGNSVLMLNIMHNTQINLQLVKIITEAGANLLEENNKKETVLTIAIRLFKKCNNKEQMLLIIKHFLEHPQVNQNVISICDGKNHPKKVLLSIFDTHYNNSDFVKLFKIIIHSQFKDESYLENVQLQNHHNLIDQTNNVSLGSIALLVNNYRPINYIRIENNRALQPYIQDLLDAGFDMQAGGLSPLTVFILKIKSGYIFNVVITGDQPEEGDEPWPHPTSNFIDFLIANGAHVGQQMLPLGCIDATLQVVREQLYLPDALLAALYTRKFSFSTMFKIMLCFVKKKITFFFRDKKKWII
jgi:ankyrin repeat protein